jgi:Holliday junction resolvase
VAPEQKLYRELKKATPKIIWNRIENLSIPGMPDLLGYNKSGTFFTVELKVTKGRKLKFSPHQIAWHVQHPNNTFILAAALGPRAMNRYQMFRGSRIMELVTSGLELEACSLGLDACRLELEACGSSA